jgi:hypothetical protein
MRALQLIRTGEWSYTSGSPQYFHILRDFAEELGYNASWGDPNALPAYGGAFADETWALLGNSTRPGLGGLPCELVHGGVGRIFGLESSCMANWMIRGSVAFLEAAAIYVPVGYGQSNIVCQG